MHNILQGFKQIDVIFTVEISDDKLVYALSANRLPFILESLAHNKFVIDDDSEPDFFLKMENDRRLHRVLEEAEDDEGRVMELVEEQKVKAWKREHVIEVLKAEEE